MFLDITRGERNELGVNIRVCVGRIAIGHHRRSTIGGETSSAKGGSTHFDYGYSPLSKSKKNTKDGQRVQTLMVRMCAVPAN